MTLEEYQELVRELQALQREKIQKETLLEQVKKELQEDDCSTLKEAQDLVKSLSEQHAKHAQSLQKMKEEFWKAYHEKLEG